MCHSIKRCYFCKIANAIKCGQISLVHSYWYLSIVDAYLLPENYWEAHKVHHDFVENHDVYLDFAKCQNTKQGSNSLTIKGV
ncbi:hypothetical protein Ldro_0229 [Legionella drozanskii LLAP-1]|uniref:Uncharacterized protein n=1 Tax=Legionella drozanskii LLAP-1 TaxID=1212489 RepID=A0A0W0TBB9_9GAMM|nr:hypothetical protein Ldro_0229 [Legionella drozanskii LLAP-1]PJE05721.1 MAG: hypothetical protein CK430_15405 [Legionella sp.]